MANQALVRVGVNPQQILQANMPHNQNFRWLEANREQSEWIIIARIGQYTRQWILVPGTS
jgi:hypothetical protein